MGGEMRFFKNIFFWFGIYLFDSRKLEYGGHNHFLAGKIFRWKLDYLVLSIRKSFDFCWHHERQEDYYDGFHNCIQIGFFQISYGT